MKTFEYLISFSNLDWEIKIKISENKGKILQKYFWFFSLKKGQLLNNIQNMFAKLSCTTFQSLKFVFYEKELKMKEIFIKLATASERILQRKHTSS